MGDVARIGDGARNVALGLGAELAYSAAREGARRTGRYAAEQVENLVNDLSSRVHNTLTSSNKRKPVAALTGPSKSKRKLDFSKRSGNTMGYPKRAPARRSKKRTARKVKRRGRKKKTFKKKKSQRVSKMREYGAETILEIGGFVSDPDLVSLQHGTAQGSAFMHVAYALYRALFEKTGYSLCNWSDVPFGAHGIRIAIAWRENVQSGTIKTGNFNAIVTDSHLAIGLKLGQFILDSVAAGASSEQGFVLIDISMDNTLVATNHYNYFSNICCQNVQVAVRQTSVLVMQNRTLGGTTTTPQNESTDVTNNPITGRYFKCNGNYLVPKGQAGSGVQSGIINDAKWGVQAGDGTFLTAGLGARLKVPNSSDVKRVLSTSRVGLNPGQIKKSKIHWSSTMQLNQFFFKLRTYIRFATSSTWDQYLGQTSLGESSVFMFEKLCDTRQSASQPIYLGYELNIITAARIAKISKPYTQRVEEVQAQAA